MNADSLSQHPAVLTRPGAPFPPLLQFGLTFALGVLIDASLRELAAPSLWPGAPGGVLIVAGSLLFASGMWTFARARTGILLQRPAARVVTHGPYRWTRNPMYLGCVLIYVGAALVFNSIVAFLLLPLVIVLVTLTVIRREERYMTRQFGEAYLDYCRRVRRWI